MSITIYFDKRGGTGGSNSVEVEGYGSSLPSASAPSMPGYDFAGYYNTPRERSTYGALMFYDQNMDPMRWWPYNHSEPLYAWWTPATYTVTLNKQSGSGGTSSVRVKYAEQMPAADAPTRDGYNFNGYYDADSQGVQYYSANMKSARNWDKTTNTTLYAQWTAKQSTVTLNKQGGVGGTSTVIATYGSAMPAITPPTKVGCTFTGYYDVDGTRYYNASGSSARNWDKTGTVTLYARWTANSYTVTLNKNGGSGGAASVSATYGSAMPSAQAPSRTGYNFIGYYDAAVGGVRYYNPDMSSARVWSKASSGKLYAQWANAILSETATTKAPTGLTISREGRKFTFTWKKTDDDYSNGLEIQWRTNLTAKGKWAGTIRPVFRTATDCSITLPASDYYPATKNMLTTVSFQVRGKRSQKTISKSNSTGPIQVVYTYDWSKWVQKDYTLIAPPVPTLTEELDSIVENKTTFAWNVSVDDNNNRPFVNIEWQSIGVASSTVTDGSKLTWSTSNRGWKTGESSLTSSSVTITEEPENLGDSYTRWFRVRARGSAGASSWRYIRHVYGKPYRPVIESASSSVSSGITTVKVTWTASANAAHPVDKVSLQYFIGTPDSNGDVPAGSSWTTAAEFADMTGKDAGQFTIEGYPDTNEALFVRVVSTRDRDSTYSAVKLVRYGAMSVPTISRVNTNASTYRAEITVVNNSTVLDSKIAVVFRDSSKNTSDIVIGVIDHDASTITVQCPNWTGKTPVSFGVYAFQGAATYSTRSADNVRVYTVSANWKSTMVWQGGNVPVAPSDVRVSETALSDEVMVEWGWSWAAANQAEISWSQNPNAWESTSAPSTFIVNHLQAAHWRVSGLTRGVVWYFRVRLAVASGDDYNWGPYSDILAIDMTSSPVKPRLVLSKDIIRKGTSFTAAWSYESPDGTNQEIAEIRQATVSGETITIGGLVTKVTTAKRVTINSEGWELGSTHYLVVRVSSTTGKQSDWSDPVPVSVADAVTCTITRTNLETLEIEGSDGVIRTRVCAIELPLTVTVAGANTGGKTTVIIERAKDYQIERPDGTESNGYEGETIAVKSIDGPGEVSIDLNDLLTQLDNGAMYRIVAMAEDKFGQTATDTKEFTVRWNHQAQAPQAQVEIGEDGAARILTVIPENADDEDTYDIYRLSVDKPELIIRNAIIGDEYVDPYPVLAPIGGYRIVYMTKYGDYIDDEDRPAWIDLARDEWAWENNAAENRIGPLGQYSIIDFDGEQILLDYNLSVGNSWSKDFKTTTYLGGSVEGDWNLGIQRKGSIGTIVMTEDMELIQALRRLAIFAGICHVRTPDGSSYSANIDVTESQSHENASKLAEITLDVTRVDADVLDGMTKDEWETMQET